MIIFCPSGTLILLFESIVYSSSFIKTCGLLVNSELITSCSPDSKTFIFIFGVVCNFLPWNFEFWEKIGLFRHNNIKNIKNFYFDLT